jgi:hypothetical protein
MMTPAAGVAAGRQASAVVRVRACENSLAGQRVRQGNLCWRHADFTRADHTAAERGASALPPAFLDPGEMPSPGNCWGFSFHTPSM